MIEVYGPYGIWHVILYSINTYKNENTYHIYSTGNTCKYRLATYTFTSVCMPKEDSDHPAHYSSQISLCCTLKR